MSDKPPVSELLAALRLVGADVHWGSQPTRLIIRHDYASPVRQALRHLLRAYRLQYRSGAVFWYIPKDLIERRFDMNL